MRPQAIQHGSSLGQAETSGNSGQLVRRASTLEMFTDGACLWPGGPGGAAAVTINTVTGKRVQELWAIAETTCNQAELLAVTQGLRRLPVRVTADVHTDSQYVLDGIAQLDTWARDGWRRRGRRGARHLANSDLWKQLHRLVRRREVVFHKVQAHVGVVDNELADQLAFSAALCAKDQQPKPGSAPLMPWRVCRYAGAEVPEFLSGAHRTPFAGVDHELWLDPAYLPGEPKLERRAVNGYGSGRGAAQQLARARTPWDIKVEAHEGTHRDFLKRYVCAAQATAWELRSGTLSPEARSFLSKLFGYATSYRMLRCAWDLTVLSGSLARGVDGLNIDDYLNEMGLLTSTLQTLKEDLRNNAYHPDRLRRVYVPKAGGRGERPIDIPTVEDRIVDRALVLALAPVLEPLWHFCSIGFRTGHGPQDGLAMAEWLIRHRKLTVVQTLDIRKAFTTIPKDRLVHTLRKSLPVDVPEQLAKLVEKIIRRPLPAGEGIRRHRGIAQGSPLSPLLLNAYLNHHLDGKWNHQRWPMIRYADDILVLADSRAETQTALTELRDLLRPNGLNLRDEIPTPADLSRGDTTEWLGYALKMESGHLRVQLTETAWTRLEQNLHRASLEGDPSGRTITEALRGWAEYAAPAHRPGGSAANQDGDLMDRITAMLNTTGMDERRLPRRVIHHMWRTAHARWGLRRRRIWSRMEKAPKDFAGAPPRGSITAVAVGCGGPLVQPSVPVLEQGAPLDSFHRGDAVERVSPGTGALPPTEPRGCGSRTGQDPTAGSRGAPPPGQVHQAEPSADAWARLAQS